MESPVEGRVERENRRRERERERAVERNEEHFPGAHIELGRLNLRKHMCVINYYDTCTWPELIVPASRRTLT